jgi:uncharacterized protein (DUF58 family)
VTTRWTPKLATYAALGALGLAAALVLGRPEAVGLAAPFLLVLAVGLPLARAPHLRAWVERDRERVLEGEEIDVAVEVETDAPVERLELLLVLPRGLEAVEPKSNPRALRLARDGSERVEVEVRCAHWDAYRFGELLLRAHDRLGLAVHDARVDRREPLRVYPRPEALRDLLRPLETQVYSGNQVSRARGEGIEFADVRQFVPGDRIKRINWRASARRQELWVNELHPERNADVVLFLDTFGEARADGRSTLDQVVRAAVSLSERYLRHKDRVGLVSFGGTLNWLLPATGIVQSYRIVDAVLESEIVQSYAWKGIDLIPARTLPPKALVLALSPLLDDRAVRALLDLRARGVDLAIVDVSPLPFAKPGPEPLDDVAFQLWELRRRAARLQFGSLGVPVAEWREDEPLAKPLAEVTAYRRSAGAVRA